MVYNLVLQKTGQPVARFESSNFKWSSVASLSATEAHQVCRFLGTRNLWQIRDRRMIAAGVAALVLAKNGLLNLDDRVNFSMIDRERMYFEDRYAALDVEVFLAS